MRNVKSIVLDVKLNDKVEFLIDHMNITVHRLVGYAEKSGNPVYKDTYYGTLAQAFNSLLSEDVLSAAELDEMTVREYLDLENKCREQLKSDIKELLKGNTYPDYAIIEQAKKMCRNCSGPDLPEEDNKQDDLEEGVEEDE